MGFFSNILIAIVSAFNPAIGFFASIVKWITSETQKASTFVLELVGNLIPTGNIIGDLAKNISIGLFADAMEVGLVKDAAEKSVPRNDITLKCDICGQYRNYYVKDENGIVCKTCFQKNLERKVEYGDKVYIFKNGIYRYHDDIKKYNFDYNYKFDFKFDFE